MSTDISVLGIDVSALNQHEQQFLLSYYDTLASLKVAQKPTINMLTMLADDNRTVHNRSIVQLIINYINKTVPRNRLPALYVIDSICKNLRNEYIILFSPHISTIFIKTYNQCDTIIQKQLIHLYNTWIKQNVFNSDILDTITKHLTSINALPSTNGNTTEKVCSFKLVRHTIIFMSCYTIVDIVYFLFTCIIIAYCNSITITCYR